MFDIRFCDMRACKEHTPPVANIALHDYIPITIRRVARVGWLCNSFGTIAKKKEVNGSQQYWWRKIRYVVCQKETHDALSVER